MASLVRLVPRRHMDPREKNPGLAATHPTEVGHEQTYRREPHISHALPAQIDEATLIAAIPESSLADSAGIATRPTPVPFG